jgi:hypothetical protein
VGFMLEYAAYKAGTSEERVIDYLALKESGKLVDAEAEAKHD